MAFKCWGFDFANPTSQGWSGNDRSTGTKRNGSHSLNPGGSDYNSPAFGSNYSTAYCGLAVNWSYLQNKRIFGFKEGGSYQISVTRESDDSLAVRRGNQGGTILAQTSAGVFSANVWHHLQLSVTVHGSTGSVELRLNSTTVASASGLNTSSTGNNYVNGLYLTGPDGLNTAFFDDVWVSDTAFLGDCKVETLYPSADGTTNNFTASGAANRYETTDETGNDDADTTYVYSSNPGDIQLFAMGNLVTTSGTVRGCGFHHVTRKDDAGAREAAAVIRSGSNSERTPVSLTESYVVYSEYLTQDPVSSTAWTIATVNAVEFGVKVAS